MRKKLLWNKSGNPVSNLPLWEHETPPAAIHLIPSLNLGGAEKIVLDLACYSGHMSGRTIIYVLDSRATDTHPIPSDTKHEIIVLKNKSWDDRLLEVASAANDLNIPVYCHLTSAKDMTSLQRFGADTIPVVHNASKGWRTDYKPIFASEKTPFIAACSNTIAKQVRIQLSGATKPVRILRHIPVVKNLLSPHMARNALKLPATGVIIGMIGRLDVQKNYVRAVKIFARFKASNPDAVLCIIGQWSFGNSPRCKEAIIRTASRYRLQIGRDVLLLGGIQNASSYLRAFDLFLNTSLWEGLSMACAEALAANIPCVVSDVGGQSELNTTLWESLSMSYAEAFADNIPLGSSDVGRRYEPASQNLVEYILQLVDIEETDQVWADAITKCLAQGPFPLTLRTNKLLPLSGGFLGSGLAMQWPWASHFVAKQKDLLRKDKVLFVTLDLNAGGAQKSLCNLVKALPATGITPILAINGEIGVPSFLKGLDDVFAVHLKGRNDNGLAARINRICSLLDRYNCGTLCFWNVDALTKSLLANILAPSPIKVVDVSPGPMLYSELSEECDDGNGTSLTARDYLDSLDAIVNKYTVDRPVSISGETWSIPNGVSIPSHLTGASKTKVEMNKIAVCGRLSASKYPELLPDIARSLLALTPDPHNCPAIHVYGGFHEHHPHLLNAFEYNVLGGSIPHNLIFHGPTNTPQDDIANAACLLMLSKAQGCPNASLEALALGVPVVANQTGGVSEQVIDGVTGILLPEIPPAPELIAMELLSICSNQELRDAMSKNARNLVKQKFSMEAMASNYATLFRSLGAD